MAAGTNKGGGKGGGKNQPRRNKNLERSSRRNVNVSFQPGINSAYRGIDQANLDFQNQDLGVQSIGGGLQHEISKLPEQYTNRTADISNDLQSALGRFSSGLNQEGLPASEVAANTAVYGTQGNNFFNHLASNDQRALQWDQSAQREGSLWERYARENLQQDLSDTQQQYYNRIADLQEQKQPAILAEMDRLRQERQANKQNKAYADMIAGLTGNYLDSGNRPRRNPGPGGGGNGGGNGGGGNGGGTVSWANIDNSGRDWGATGDTGVGGNQGTGGAPPGDQPQTQLAQQIQRRVKNIGGAVDFADIPPWLQELYRYTPDENPQWGELLLGNYSPLQKQVFRRTRPEVQQLLEQAILGGAL